MLNAVSLPALTFSAPPRQRLLEVNGGGWEGLFLRLGPDGREIEWFPTRWRLDGNVEVTLSWNPDADVSCRIERGYSTYGQPEPLQTD